jgi:predicted nucleic acid-binding protein
MHYLLDTNILSDLVKRPQGAVAARIAAVGGDQVCTSLIVAAELRYGAAKRGSENSPNNSKRYSQRCLSSPSKHRPINDMVNCGPHWSRRVISSARTIC